MYLPFINIVYILIHISISVALNLILEYINYMRLEDVRIVTQTGNSVV